MPGPLGRRPPSDWTHVDKYPLTARTAPAKPTPVVIGVNWYAEFDKPQKDAQGHYWIARDAKLTTVRGGHCVCLKPQGPQRSRRLVGLLQPGDRRRLRRVRHQPPRLPAQPQALRRLLALPRGAEDRRVAGRGLRRHERPRRPGHPAQARPLRDRRRADQARGDRRGHQGQPLGAQRRRRPDTRSATAASTTSTSSTRGAAAIPTSPGCPRRCSSGCGRRTVRWGSSPIASTARPLRLIP